MFRPSRTTWCWKPMSTWTPSNSIAADSPTLLLHGRGHGRRCVDGDGAALHLCAAARASTRPDVIAAIAHGQRDRCAGREAARPSVQGMANVPSLLIRYVVSTLLVTAYPIVHSCAPLPGRVPPSILRPMPF